MVNRTNCSTSSSHGKRLAELIMNAIAGRAGVHINGEIVQSNSLRSKLFVGEKSIPVDLLHTNLTEHELTELENLPFWNGNNEYEISSKVLCHVGAAINRFEWKTELRGYYSNHDAGLGYIIEAKEEELTMCRCKECACARSAHE